jgi:hypothetical protein
MFAHGDASQAVNKCLLLRGEAPMLGDGAASHPHGRHFAKKAQERFFRFDRSLS